MDGPVKPLIPHTSPAKIKMKIKTKTISRFSYSWLVIFLLFVGSAQLMLYHYVSIQTELNKSTSSAKEWHSLFTIGSQSDSLRTKKASMPITRNDPEKGGGKQNGPRRSICDNGTNVTRYWTHSNNLAQWTKDYFDWHIETRCNEDKLEVREKTNYMIIQCITDFKFCGGIADRLHTLPVYVWLASISKRVLLIQWERPAKLEEFFVPPEGGIDWTVPEWLQPEIPRAGKSRKITLLASKASNDGTKIVTGNVQVHASAVSEYFNNAMIDAAKDGTAGIEVGHEDAFSHDVVLRDIFHSLFTLSPPVESIFLTQMEKMGLVPGQYVTAHIRSRYPALAFKSILRKQFDMESVDKEGGLKMEGAVRDFIAPIATNALHCAGNLLPEKPIYLASDSDQVIRYLLDESDFASALKRKAIPPIVTYERDGEPLHLDTKDYAIKEPHQFYSIFVDLWILGEARCTSYGMGGFGRFGMHLSYNASCGVNHRNYTEKIQECPSIL